MHIDTDDAEFSFYEPSDEWCPRVRQLLLQLPITAVDERDHIEAFEVATMIGGLDAALTGLRAALEEDYDDLKSGPDPWWGTFDYVVMIETSPRHCLEVLTRLYTTPDSNASCYGRTVKRLGSDRFALWVHV